MILSQRSYFTAKRLPLQDIYYKRLCLTFHNKQATKIIGLKAGNNNKKLYLEYMIIQFWSHLCIMWHKYVACWFDIYLITCLFYYIILTLFASRLLFQAVIPGCYSRLLFQAVIPGCYSRLLFQAVIPGCYSKLLFQAVIPGCYSRNRHHHLTSSIPTERLHASHISIFTVFLFNTLLNHFIRRKFLNKYPTFPLWGY